MSESLKFANALFIDEMYRLGPDAEDMLALRGIVPAEPWVRAARIGGHSVMPSRIIRLAHDHMASEIAIDIEIGARAAPELRFVNHVEMIKADASRRRSGAALASAQPAQATETCFELPSIKLTEAARPALISS